MYILGIGVAFEVDVLPAAKERPIFSLATRTLGTLIVRWYVVFHCLYRSHRHATTLRISLITKAPALEISRVEHRCGTLSLRTSMHGLDSGKDKSTTTLHPIRTACHLLPCSSLGKSWSLPLPKSQVISSP